MMDQELIHMRVREYLSAIHTAMVRAQSEILIVRIYHDNTEEEPHGNSEKKKRGGEPNCKGKKAIGLYKS